MLAETIRLQLEFDEKGYTSPDTSALLHGLSALGMTPVGRAIRMHRQGMPLSKAQEELLDRYLEIWEATFQ